MRKITSALAAFAMVSSSFGIATAASAHSYTFQGLVNVTKGISLECTLTVVKTPDHDENGNHLNTGTVVVTIGPPEPLCAALNITSNPMNYVQGAADPITGWKDMTIYDFRAETITLGNCAGDVEVKKREVSPGNWEMDVTTVIPEESTGGPCIVDGIIPSI